ncbi:MAG TPA: FGGY family carbohydrate kinase [Caldilineaceae bacterium]|nr:FGGY family carbohydrate kinase [Caldilineaceae bacterium]
MKYLALDLGTSFLKGAVLDLEQLTIEAAARRPFPPPIADLPPLFCEVNPAAIVAATRELLDELAGHAPEAAGVVVCSQMHGLVLMGRHGEALSNAVTWQDQRALLPNPRGDGTLFEFLQARIPPAQQQALGNGLKPSLPLCTLAWWAARSELPAGAIPASLPDYVLATLSGSPPVVEPTLAASMGALDLPTGRWHAVALANLGLGSLAWPPLVEATAPAYELPVGRRRLPCYPPVGDHQCAVLGALLQPGELSLNISTGSQVSVLAPRFRAGDYEVRPYFDGGYLQTITRIPAGRALNALVDLLLELAQAEGIPLKDPWATIAAAVAATPETDLQVDLAFFASPVGDRGAITNIREETLTIGHLFRAAFQAMARNYRLCAERLAPPATWQRLVYSGGVAQRFAPLRDEIGAAFGTWQRLCPTTEDTLLGLLALALRDSGRASSVAEATRLLWARYIEPADAGST